MATTVEPTQAQAITPDHILQIGSGFWASKTLLSAVELGVFTELARQPATAHDLRRRLQLQERGSLDFFAALYADQDRLRQFLHAMTGLSMGASQAIARQFPWQRYQAFADLGTAEGGLPVQVAVAHPHLTGIGFDVPAAQPIFEDYVAGFGLTDRLEFRGGDFFVDPLPCVDVLVMGHILHDWNLDERKRLIARAYQALPPGGALIAYDAVIDDERRANIFGLLMSLNMLIETPAGSDYTGAECSAWMREAGFRQTYVEPLVGPDSMVVGLK